MRSPAGRIVHPLRESLLSLPRHLIVVGVLLVILPLVGTAGYMIIEGWEFLDSLYMAIITVTTIGFAEVQPLSEEGRVFSRRG